MNRVVVVTDSTANLPEELAAAYNFPIIPLHVHWGGEDYLDGQTLDTETFYRWLQERSDFPTTSQPSVGEFIEFFKQVAEKYETTSIVGVFISADLSGTMASAIQAQAELPTLNIELLDSRSVSMGLGFQALLAARAAQAGATPAEIREQIMEVRERMHVIFAVDTLDYLHRGGRIGGAARLLGTALNLKPVLTVHEGKVDALQKVRKRKKSLRRVIEIAEERLAGQHPAELCIVQAEADPGDLAQFETWVRERLRPERLYYTTLTPVVGTHGGPGTLGVAFYTEEKK